MNESHESEHDGGAGLIGASLLGLALGAGLMYIIDPDRGRRRRALLRDQSKHAWTELQHAANVTARDVGNRTSGLIAGASSKIKPQQASEETIAARVRAALGHAVSHPRAVHVTVQGEEVTVQGDVLADELNALLSRVASVPGVRLLHNHLDVHEHPGNVPGLQGGEARRAKLQQGGWSPTERLIVGTASSALAAYGIARGGAVGSMLAAAGVGALLRAITNMDAGQLTGIGEHAEDIVIQKSLHLNAPVDRVFRFWQDLENFPRFMSHIHDVRDLGGGISHWSVAGPAGSTIEWDTVISESIDNQMISWRTVGAPDVEHSGSIRFIKEGADRTRVDIRLSYRPPAGTLGHMVNSLFGTDPQHSMDEDLARLKSLLEHGKTSIGGQEVWLEDLSREDG